MCPISLWKHGTLKSERAAISPADYCYKNKLSGVPATNQIHRIVSVIGFFPLPKFANSAKTEIYKKSGSAIRGWPLINFKQVSFQLSRELNVVAISY
jgi:hypothetical protein